MRHIFKREKKLFIYTLGFIGLWLVYTHILSPKLERLNTLEQLITQKKEELNQVRSLSEQYQSLENTYYRIQEKIESQDEEFALVPYIEKTLNNQNLMDNVKVLDPRIIRLEDEYFETIVTLELTDITLNKFVDFVSQLQASTTATRIGTIHIETNNNRLNTTLEIHNIKLVPDKNIKKTIS